MKVYFSKYRDHWLSPYTILEKAFFWREIEYNEPVVQRWVNILAPLCVGLQKFLDIVHPKINYVKIDRWDTWSMDHTLSTIVVPMLKQLKATKHGAPFVDDADVPEGLGLRSTEAPPKTNDYDTDDNWFKRWDWVLDEMIWAHEQLADGDSESQFFDHSAVDDNADFSDQIGQVKVDSEGLKAHNERVQHGLMLFGRYYRSMWD